MKILYFATIASSVLVLVLGVFVLDPAAFVIGLIGILAAKTYAAVTAISARIDKQVAQLRKLTTDAALQPTMTSPTDLPEEEEAIRFLNEL